ncbi:Holliday junction resolvase RuvX [Rhodocytophaga rosea]|uniref:Putative pre-16S rRNA nuclease n=1 Tax=Rhodocytophaga rosea TaxID=2704465 RepID=A0A6C0GDK1_9BACT|nr:Holliday junction resolvase RuvX [Rhodocytophaga rosea]QHT65904.1 Holliday junction resolvase RuvX [Rhodocytophaga rosea]
MGRLVAIDYGAKRVGIAVTDPLQIIATALETVAAKDVLAYLKTYDQAENIDAFVVGMPRRLDNTATSNTPLVERFVRQLQAQFPEKPIHLIDERFTSKTALQTMIAGGMKKKDRRDKANVDKISAVIILQTYMQSKK